MGTALASFVASGCIFLKMQLREIMPVCALLQRMAILAFERKNHEKIGEFGLLRNGTPEFAV